MMIRAFILIFIGSIFTFKAYGIANIQTASRCDINLEKYDAFTYGIALSASASALSSMMSRMPQSVVTYPLIITAIGSYVMNRVDFDLCEFRLQKVDTLVLLSNKGTK